jgi:hypothetical protein
MANLNLSEFTEKTFVADADWTFVWDTAGLISKKVSRNSLLNSGTLTTSAPVTISQTWSTTGTYTAAKIDVTETATAAAASLLLDLQMGGARRLSVRKNGLTYIAGTLVTPNGLNITSSEDGGNQTASFTTDGVRIPSQSVIGFTSASSGFGAQDTILLRDGAANTLALRNGTNAQAFRVYNTYTDASNFERAGFEWGSNVCNFGTHASGSGVFRKLALLGSGIDFVQSNVGLRWSINTSGHFLAGTDNQFDIGASGANRPRNVYVGTGLISGGSVTTSSSGYFAWTGTSAIASTSVGVITLLNTTGTDFNRLNFGAFTDAAPAIARDGAGIKFTGAAAGLTSHIKVPAVAVSALPLAATAGVGARAFVNDATAPVFGSAVTGGGAVAVPVYSTGSAWNVG